MGRPRLSTRSCSAVTLPVKPSARSDSSSALPAMMGIPRSTHTTGIPRSRKVTAYREVWHTEE